MADLSIGQSSFNQGELGRLMEGRADNPVYARALSKIENWIIVPQGGLFHRPGFELVNDVDTTDSLNVRLTRFSFNKQQEYVQLWREREVRIFRQKSLVSTVATPFSGAETRVLRAAQSGDVQILTHFNHPPQLLERLGSDTAWGISELVIDPLPFFAFNRTHKIAPSSAAVASGVTFTLSDSDEGYWNAGHFGNDILIKFNDGEATLKEPQQDATGGTPLSGAGTAANAFDGSDGTSTAAGADGWIGYDFTADTVVRVVGFRVGSATTYNLVFETDDNASFSTPSLVASATFTSEVDTWVYIDIPRHTGETHFRIRETGGADLDVKQLVFNKGLAAIGDTTSAFLNTDATKVFKEQAWGPHHGYPRTVEFIGNRLAFGGTRDEPATAFFGKDGDLFNFDDTTTDADAAFARTLSTDQNHFIRDMKAERDGLVIFTSDGVFNLDGDGAPITPTNVSIEPQTRIGVSTVAVGEVDGDLHYSEANGKSISSIAFDFGRDQYVTDNKNTLAHHLFVEGQKPRAMTGLRGWRDTQANLLFVPREDGQMAVLTQDASKQVLSWSRFVTYNPDSSQAKFRDAVVVETDHGESDINGDPIVKPTLYAIVERTVDGATKTFLEALTEEDVHLDHWFIGEVTNQEVTAAAVAAAGSSYAVNDILTVAGGTGTAATMKVTAVDGSGAVTGIKVRTSGDYSATPSNPVSVTGGGGTGATLTLTFDLKAKTGWSGLTTLPNSTITVVGDGFVVGEATVDGSGDFTITTAVKSILTGIFYDSPGQTMKLPVISGGQVLRGNPMTLKEAVMDFDETLDFEVNGYPVRFRSWNNFVFETGLEKFTGQKRIKISNRGSGSQRDPKVDFNVREPVACTLLALTIKAKVGV